MGNQQHADLVNLELRVDNGIGSVFGRSHSRRGDSFNSGRGCQSVDRHILREAWLVTKAEFSSVWVPSTNGRPNSRGQNWRHFQARFTSYLAPVVAGSGVVEMRLADPAGGLDLPPGYGTCVRGGAMVCIADCSVVADDDLTRWVDTESGARLRTSCRGAIPIPPWPCHRG